MVEYVNLKLHLDIFFKVSSNLQKMSWKQSGIKCGVGSHRKFAIFWLITRNQDFCDKKCRIPAFRDKTLLNTVLPTILL